MNEEEIKQRIDQILMEMEGKYFSSQYDDQATEAIRWPAIDDLLALLRTEVLNTEKAYGGCHNCFGKGYATANEFASGRGVKWRISNMRFCKCDRGKQLKEMFDIEVLKAMRREIMLAPIWKQSGKTMTAPAWALKRIKEIDAQLQANQKEERE